MALPAWKGHGGFSFLSERFGVPVLVDNNANLGALAEHWWGAGQGVEDVTYIKIGTGIGSGHIVGGRLYRGATGAAGEIGHIAIDPQGAPCSCGLRGCLCTLVGAHPLVLRAAALRAEHPDSRLASGEHPRSPPSRTRPWRATRSPTTWSARPPATWRWPSPAC